MHILLAPMGTPGDVQPFVDLGVELRARGHRATLVANGFFREWAGKAGLEFIELLDAEQYRRVLDDRNLWVLRNAHRVFGKRLVIPSIRRLFEIIREAHVPGKTVVVAQTLALGARVA